MKRRRSSTKRATVADEADDSHQPAHATRRHSTRRRRPSHGWASATQATASMNRPMVPDGRLVSEDVTNVYTTS